MAIDFQLGEGTPPFEEAVNAFLAKKIMTRSAFNALAAQMRVKAFTAAYVHAADQLQTVYQAVRRAIEKGTTLADFKQDVGYILTRPWHRETVFRTNVLAAYGKGHYDQAQASRKMRPYGRYSAVMDGRTRPSHARLHGLVYPLDHPFWQTYWPPWGYNCRCGVTTLSQMEVDEAGLKVQQDLQGLPQPEARFVSPAAGEWQPDLGRLPVGIKQNVLEGLLRADRAEIFANVNRDHYLALVKKHLTQTDLNDFETLLWADEAGGIEGYKQWAARVLQRQTAQGELYPLGNIPADKIELLPQKPSLALVVIDDQILLHAGPGKKPRAALTTEQILSIPEKFTTGEWFLDKHDPALLLCWQDFGDKWLKVVIRLNRRIKGTKAVANEVRTFGVVQQANLNDPRYEKI